VSIFDKHLRPYEKTPIFDTADASRRRRAHLVEDAPIFNTADR
jgi:hypothetical protein